MFLAAFASLRDPASKAFCDRKRAEGKRHNAALICLARRRCDVILAMLRNREHYQLVAGSRLRLETVTEVHPLELEAWPVIDSMLVALDHRLGLVEINDCPREWWRPFR
jgi:hypothetical protein